MGEIQGREDEGEKDGRMKREVRMLLLGEEGEVKKEKAKIQGRENEDEEGG